MPPFVKGAWVWFESASDSWVPVRMMASKDGKTIVAKSHWEEEFVLEERVPMPEVNECSLNDTDNMVEMQELSEAAILHNLRLRFAKNVIYTYISSILVSVNPFKALPIYSPDIMGEYRSELSRGAKLAPHVYALADAAFKQMTMNRQNQSVIISGESGAGKTEATKLVLQYMAEMSGQSSEVEQQILETNPIMEAFGNAKTVRNHNSSRFGKWIEISFDGNNHIGGAQLVTYLLEQSRIVEPGAGERNYHIFYQLCQGLPKEQRQAWKIGEAESFRVCAAGKCLKVPGTDDFREFKEMLLAMDVMAFSKQEQVDLIQTTCAVMHLGNIDFAGEDKASVTNPEVLAIAANLLGVEPNALREVLVSSVKAMGREVVRTVLGRSAAESSRDALCKAVYSNQFSWLVSRLNKSMFKKVESAAVVGVLDIFGFEIFDVNRFEQFCINFTNEKMQQHFNEHIFTMEQDEYKTDAIDVAQVEFIDNKACLNLIETGRNCILALCDDELKVPKGSDNTLLERLNKEFGSNKNYVVSKKREPKFGIVHYAGHVDYHIGGFMQKNLNKLSPDLASLIAKSSRPFVQKLAPDASSATVGARFKGQLAELMSSLRTTQPHFIRCLKPNSLKVSDTFDGSLVLRQLRYLGLKEVVRIRQLGFPIRRLHKEFYERYRMLLTAAPKDKGTDFAQLATEILNSTKQDSAHWRVGKSKVFVRNQIQVDLEQKREKRLISIVSGLQALAKAKETRKRYLRLRAIEQEMQEATESEDPKLLDGLISRYESLQMNLNPKLLEKCIRRRNFLIKRQAAERALEAAIKSKDVALLQAALEKAKEVDVPALSQKGQALYDRLILCAKTQEKAIEKRDLAIAREAVALAEELDLHTSIERQIVALVSALETEAQVKQALEEAIASRDLNTLRHALEVAMATKSGMMVDNALQRALDAGLQNDPLVQQALALEKTLDREVTVAKMESELEAAHATGDLQILELTVKVATEAGLGEHALTAKCQEKILWVKKSRSIGQLLVDAENSKNLSALEAAIAQAQANEMTHLNEFLGAVKTRDALIESIRRVKVFAEAAERSRLKAEKLRAEKEAAAKEAAKEAERQQIKQGEEKAAKQAEEERMAKAAQLAEEERQAKEEQEREHAQLEEALNAAMAMGAQDQEMQQAAEKHQRNNAADGARTHLEEAVKSGDISSLQTALKRSESLGPLDYVLLSAAQDALEDLQTESVNRERELAEAQAAALEEEKGGRPSESQQSSHQQHDIHGRKNSLPESETGDETIVFDPAEYSQDKYALEKFPMLKSVGDFVKTKTSRSGVGNKAQEKLGMLRYTKDNLVSGLTKLPSDMEEKAIQLFKSVQGFMGDRYYTYTDVLVIHILDTMVSFPPLRNEAYVQIAKQLHHNPKKESRYLGWVLLALLADYVAPEDNFLNYLMHLTQNTEINAGGEDYAEFVRNALVETLRRGPPTKRHGESVCTAEYVAAFRNRSMKGADVPVYLLDGTCVKLPVKPWEPASILLEDCFDAFKLVDCEHFSLYEHKDNTQTRVEVTESVLDYISTWPEDAIDEKMDGTATITKKTRKKWDFFSTLGAGKMANLMGPQKPKTRPCFYLLKRLEVPPYGDSGDPLNRKLTALQMARDFSMGNLPVTEDEAITFAAYGKRLSALPPSGPTAPHWTPLILDQCPAFLKIDKFTEKVTKKLSDPMLKSADVVTNYLTFTKNMPLFGAQSWEVRKEDSEPFQNLILSINMHGVHLLNAQTRVVEYYFELENLLGWTCSPLQVNFMVRLSKRQAGKSKLLMKLAVAHPRVGRDVCNLLMDYCHYCQVMKNPTPEG